MTRSAHGTLEEPGRKVGAKQALNRRILDQAWGLPIHQFTYKAGWAGRKLAGGRPGEHLEDLLGLRGKYAAAALPGPRVWELRAGAGP